MFSFFHPRMGAQSFRTTTLNTKWIDRTTFPKWWFLSSIIDFTAGNRTVPPPENMAMWHFPPTLNCRRESIVWVKNVKKKLEFWEFISISCSTSYPLTEKSAQSLDNNQSVHALDCALFGDCVPGPGILSQNWIQAQKIKGRSCSNRYSFSLVISYSLQTESHLSMQPLMIYSLFFLHRYPVLTLKITILKCGKSWNTETRQLFKRKSQTWQLGTSPKHGQASVGVPCEMVNTNTQNPHLWSYHPHI